MKKVSLVEILAGLSIMSKVVEYIGAVFDKHGEEAFKPVGTVLNELSVILLMASILFWLRLSAKKLEQLDRISAKLESMQTELDNLDKIGRFGSAAALVQNLSEIHDQSGAKAHCRAGTQTISPLLFTQFPKAIKEFYDLNRGDENKLTMRDQHIIDTFLLNLIKQLPRGSIWFGVSCLLSPDAWSHNTATLAYYEFQRNVQRRTRSEEIDYFRLWSFDTDQQKAKMSDILQEQQREKLIIRCITGPEEIKDISIIWVPVPTARSLNGIRETDSPIHELESHPELYQPLCSIGFATRGGRILDEMTIHSPDTDNFREMCMEFQTLWVGAEKLKS